MIRRKAVNLLLVEDDPSHVALCLVAVERANQSNDKPLTVEVARDGEQALKRLRSGPRPDLILLDLRLPRKSGQEVLQEIKRDEALRVIPVIILTTSELEQDIMAAYSDYVAAYIVKPLRMKPLIEEIGKLKGFWTSDNLRYPV